MKNDVLAKKILDAVGGSNNILSNTICMTRLRLSLKDMSLAKIDELKAIEGVLGVVEGDGLQVILGPGKVSKVGAEFSKIAGVKANYENAKELAKENKAVQKQKHDKGLQRLLRRIANIFIPLLPGIIAAGLVNGITNVINVSTGGAFSGLWWYETIRTISWGLFGFLPILVGYNAAREFGGTGVLGAIMGAFSMNLPAMPLLKTLANDEKIMMPLTNAAYNPAAGGLLAALFMGILIAYLEKNIRKVMPNILETFLTPLVSLLIGSFFAVLIIQPIGAFVTQGIFGGLNFVYEKLGVAGGYILSAGFLPLVSVGLHQALTPIHVLLNDPAGPTMGVNYLLPILMMAGGGQVGAGLALYFKSKNKKLKQLTRDSLPVGILGIGEPMMYAVTLPLGKPFITACLGAGVGGVLAVLFKLGTITQGVSGLFGLLITVPGTQLQYAIAMIGAYIGGFVLTWFFGVDEKRIDEVYGDGADLQ